jgi:DNA end-binding protein Ku
LPKRNVRKGQAAQPGHATPVRALWSGSISFGLVSIPVELLSAVQPRQTALKLVDKDGHALGREYHCSKEGKKLSNDELVRGYETEQGKIIEITDAEFESVAPEMSGEIDLRSFVPLAQIPPLYFQKPYLLAPSGKSAKAYHLLAATLERTGRVGMGSFVMRGHEYLVAILSDNGMLRADTLRYADEVRSPAEVGLPKKPGKTASRKVAQFVKDIDALTREALDVGELQDQEAHALQRLVAQKQKNGEDVVHPLASEDADPEGLEGGAKIIDLMAVLKRTLAKTTVVATAEKAQTIDLAEHRSRKQQSSKRKKTARRAVGRKKSSAKRVRAQKSG